MIATVSTPPSTTLNHASADNVITGTVPEPATLSLLAVGLVALARRRG